MNTLSYGLLSLLSFAPLSGYDLTQKIKPLWQAGHSQIYPLLASMEQQGYISYKLIEQTDKPDKKEYTITEAGLAQLRQWVEMPAEHPVLRDELHFKLYSLWLSEPQKAKELLYQRMEFCQSELDRYNEMLGGNETLREERGESHEPKATTFGRYMLIRKRIMDMESSLQFCKYALEELEI
ncbi:PadR family transcriptional regulator [Paenibacillus segetis]|uniref:PadR family transcriptional regulator n=1 Tax=Paenibacillus segetis TaxID=1325360 RepID=A0ABQ1Y454_9BACL|nr:PadR family transcriptional regulator [Paenibacillus segetis]GGH10816.1 PadR family transcriptional regulator [Paenibacillus segetis]